ncbi:exodeoxyribonuclease VII small subunit [Sporosarcina sp. P21c]|nr:exodeoxyribonuclease VII small subunit [Sporosarcina sp. P21c]
MDKNLQENIKKMQEHHQQKKENNDDLFDQLNRIEEKLDRILKVIDK